ncbi:MAG: hypothetical protein NC218_10495 [Acetobacter sp.]|nr:hypothetical protein [Acetobacter sp.]
MTASLVCGLPRLLPYGAPRNDGGGDPLTNGVAIRGMTVKSEYSFVSFNMSSL